MRAWVVNMLALNRLSPRYICVRIKHGQVGYPAFEGVVHACYLLTGVCMLILPSLVPTMETHKTVVLTHERPVAIATFAVGTAA